MLAAFCLRLAFGSIAPLLILPIRVLHPRFVRTQFLVAMGLCVVAALFTPLQPWHHFVAIVAAAMLALCGSVVWTLDPAPFGHVILNACLLLLLAAVSLPIGNEETMRTAGFAAACDGVTSSMLLGGALTAMLVGHSYLISPGLTITPLNRMIAWLVLAICGRIAVASVAAWIWSHESDKVSKIADVSLWLPVRWLVGFFVPFGFALMAWMTARIRSTQSATGILYVVVICVFLGELIGLLLLVSTGLPL